MTRRSLPPLNALRAFETAARLRSLAAASDELGVTASAVGHQIRALERHLGVRLFDRSAKRLTLTETGRRYAEALGRSFESLHLATDAVRRQHQGRPITVSATPAIALRWLAPVLDRLRQEGFAEFRIDASSREADLGAGEADLDIRYGRAVGPELVSCNLFSEVVFPVCHPGYAERMRLREPSDLVLAELFFVDDWARRGGVWSAWKDWFEVAGLQVALPPEAARFSEMDRAVAAAAEGRGVAIGAQRHLDRFPDGDSAAGALIRLFPEPLSLRYSTFLVALPEVAEDPVIRRLMRRLVAVAGQSTSVLHEGAF